MTLIETVRPLLAGAAGWCLGSWLSQIAMNLPLREDAIATNEWLAHTGDVDQVAMPKLVTSFNLAPRRPHILCQSIVAGGMAAIATWDGATTQGGVHALLLLLLVTLAATDVRHYLLPDSLTLPTLWAGLCASAAGLTIHPSSAISAAVAAYLFFAFVGKISVLIRGGDGGLGQGDYKFIAAAGAWVGLSALPALFLLSTVVAAIQMIAASLFARRDAGAVKPPHVTPAECPPGAVPVRTGSRDSGTNQSLKPACDTSNRGASKVFPAKMSPSDCALPCMTPDECSPSMLTTLTVTDTTDRYSTGTGCSAPCAVVRTATAPATRVRDLFVHNATDAVMAGRSVCDHAPGGASCVSPDEGVAGAVPPPLLFTPYDAPCDMPPTVVAPTGFSLLAGHTTTGSFTLTPVGMAPSDGSFAGETAILATSALSASYAGTSRVSPGLAPAEAVTSQSAPTTPIPFGVAIAVATAAILVAQRALLII